jgi:serine/threonine-protein kinase RsbW
MAQMQTANRASSSQSPFSGKRSRSSILEIDTWMPSETQAISPTLDRLMRLVEGLQCIPGAEPDVELALREALVNAVVHGNQKDPGKKVHIRCRCGPGKEISVVVTDQGKGFDFEKTVGNGLIPDPAADHGRGIPLMKVYMDDVHFERDGSEVHMRKCARNNSH